MQTVRYEVEVKLPDGMTVETMRRYVKDAVGCWAESKDPESPVHQLDRKSIKVRVAREDAPA